MPPEQLADHALTRRVDRSADGVVGNRVLVAGPKISPMELVQLIGTAKGFIDHVPEVVFSLYPVSG